MIFLKNVLKNICVIFLALAIFVVGAITENLLQNFFGNYYLQLIVPCIVRIIVTVVLAAFFSAKVLKINAEELGIKNIKIDFKWIVISAVLPVSVLALYIFILPGHAYIAKEGNFLQYLAYAVFGVGISAGITEEVIFRGMIFRYMKKTLGTKAAVIIPAVIFACLHIINMQTFDLTDLVLLLLAGSLVAVMFVFMALTSDSIYPGALAHTLWNTLIIGEIIGVGGIVNGMPNDSFIIVPIESQSKLLTGGNFGIEAAVPAIIGYIAVSVISYSFYKKKNKTDLKKELQK